MQGVYGGFIIVILYGRGASSVIEDFFMYLDDTPFTLLSGEKLTLLGQ